MLKRHGLSSPCSAYPEENRLVVVKKQRICLNMKNTKLCKGTPSASINNKERYHHDTSGIKLQRRMQEKQPLECNITTFQNHFPHSFNKANIDFTIDLQGNIYINNNS